VQIEEIPLWFNEITKDVVSMFETYILSLGFMRSNIDHYLYYKEEGVCFIYVALYLDDMLLAGKNMDTIKEVNM
jgi:hypothetical protein